MKNRYSLIIALLITCCSLYAQNTFQVDYQVAGILNIPGNIIQNPLGQYVMAGTGTSFIPLRGTVTAIDSASNVVWSKGYVSSIATQINDIKNVSSGGYIVTGASNPGLVLMRLNATGGITWANTYHFTGANSSAEENGTRVLPTSDGGFVVSGYVYQVDPDGAGPLARQDSANCYCLKVNSTGVLQWAKIFFLSTAYINDHFLSDVAEVADGYVFGGSMSEGQQDAAGTYALLLKTDFNGNLQWIKRWGPANTDAEVNSLTALNSNQVLVSGDDNSKAFYVNLNASGTGTIASGYKYTGAGLLGPLTANYSGFVTNDSSYGFVGSYINPLAFSFNSYVMKVNPANGNILIGESYSAGLSSILPIGRQVKDSGYVMMMTSQEQSLFGFDFHVVKTNALGLMNASSSSCPVTAFSPSKSTYSVTTTAVTPPDTLFGSTASAFTPVVSNLTPLDTVNCLAIVCTPPANPTASASPSTICPSGSSTITGTGSGNITYKVYDAATGGNLLGAAPLVVHPTSTTTYYVEASSSNGCVSTSRASVTVNVTSVPVSVGAITGSSTPCVGAQAYSISSVTNATTYAWSVSGGGSITGGQGTTNVTVTWTTAGAYTLSVSATNSCGTATNSVNVTVSGAPGSATINASPNPACVGQAVTLGVTSAGATSYSWSGPNSFTSTSQSIAFASVAANQAGNYTVTATNNCGSATAQVNLVVNSIPTALVATASPNPVCQGQTVNLGGSASGGTSYAWHGPNGYTSTLQSNNLNNIQANQGGTYTFIATNACGSDSAFVNLTVNTKPTAVSATAVPNPVCAGSTVSLNGAATGASSYAWSGPNSFTATTQNSSVTNFQNNNVGTYTLSATNTCGTTTSTVVVNIATVPTGVSATANTTSTCFNTNIQFTGTSTGGVTYGWTGPNGFTSTTQNPGISNSVVADSGAYVFTATNTCGSTSSTIVVNVDTLIRGFAGQARGGDTLCSGYQLTLTGLGVNVNSWLWTGPNGFTTTSQDTTVTNAGVINSGQYILTGTNACGTQRDTFSITIENGNSLGLLATSSAVHDSACFGSTVNLFASDSFDTYAWTGPNGFVSTVQNPTIINGSVSQSGMYVVTATNHCGSRMDSVRIYIDTIPQGLQLSTTGANNASCQGQSITVTAAAPGVTAFAWTGPSSFSSNQASFTISNIQPNQQGNYIVTATNSCGNKIDTIAVTVYNTPDSLFVSASSDSICPGLSVTLSAKPGLTNVVWNNAQTGSSIQANQPGAYYYTAQDGNACSVHSDSIHVYNAVPPVLNLVASNPASICQGQQTIVLHASSDATVALTWSPGGSTADTLLVTNSGKYIVVGEKNGCFASDTINLTLAQLPSISFTDTSINTCCLDVEVTPSVTGNIASYQWSDTTSAATDLLMHTGIYTVTVTTDKGCTATGSVSFNKVCIQAHATANPDSIHVEGASLLNVTTAFGGVFNYQWAPLDSISNSTSSNPVVNPKQTTTYTVAVYDTVSGCSDTTAVIVYVSYDANFAIPNVFSPNGDGYNDTWYVISQGGLVTVQDLRVFDRWGELVFDSQRDGTLEWNGDYQGKKELMGNYVYTVKLKINATGEEKFVKGNLALIR